MPMTLLTWPNLSGFTSQRPHSWYPPPPGRSGLIGALTQYVLKFAEVTAVLRVALRLPNQRRA